jgi:ribosomal-protein-alanine N-acetyltransferase
MRAPISVRLATRGDVYGIAAMSRDLVEQGLSWRWTPERVLRSLRNPRTNIAVVSEDRMILGFGIMKYEEDEAHLLLFAVHPMCRRRGVGAAILEWLEAVARTAGLSRIALECRRENGGAREFYGALGYHEQQIVHRMYEGVEDGITLEKWLTVP